MKQPQPQLINVPRLTWEQFSQRFNWRQGEHVSLLGDTGSGKSTLMLNIIKRRSYVALFLTKMSDPPILAYIKREKYKRIVYWPDYPEDTHYALWPKLESEEDFDRQEKTFKQALWGYKRDREKVEGILEAGNWCVVIDEVYYHVDMLNMTRTLKQIWTQGRSSGISLVAAAQRPRGIPREMVTQARHLFFWQFDDSEDINRLAEIGSQYAPTIEAIVPQLKEHEFLYINRKERVLYRSTAPKV